MKVKTKAFWVRMLHQWHWISAAISLAALLLFAGTGITLNHAAHITSQPTIITKEARLPEPLLAQFVNDPNAPEVTAWFKHYLGLRLSWTHAEWDKDEVYMDLPRPGGDAWLSLDLHTGDVFYESTSRGWIAWLNDLHKGRNTGKAWSWFIDIVAAACVVFAITGLVLLQIYSKNRPSTWPLVAVGILAPFMILILFSPS